MRSIHKKEGVPDTLVKVANLETELKNMAQSATPGQTPTTTIFRRFPKHAKSQELLQQANVGSCLVLAMDLESEVRDALHRPIGTRDEGRPAQQTTDEEPPTGATRKTSLKTMTPGSEASGGSTCIWHCVYPPQATDAACAPLGPPSHVNYGVHIVAINSNMHEYCMKEYRTRSPRLD